MNHTDIMILLASKMQSIVNFTVSYNEVVYKKYQKEFIHQVNQNAGRMLREIAKLSSVTLYYLFGECDID